MKNLLLLVEISLVCVFIGFTSSLSAAQSVPYCWQSNQPGAKIEDGLFRVQIPTANHNALQVAEVIGVLGQALAYQAGVASSDNLDHIEVDVLGDVSHWERSGRFQTVGEFKDAIVESIAPVLQIPGVSVECAVIPKHHRVP